MEETPPFVDHFVDFGYIFIYCFLINNIISFLIFPKRGPCT